MVPEKKCGLKPSTQEKLNSIFTKFREVDEVILYGSRANGKYKDGSDIDLVIKSESITLKKLLEIENEIDDLLLPYKVDLSIYSQISNSALIEHINLVGAIFYKKS